MEDGADAEAGEVVGSSLCCSCNLALASLTRRSILSAEKEEGGSQAINVSRKHQWQQDPSARLTVVEPSDARRPSVGLEGLPGAIGSPCR